MREILFRGKTADKAREWIEGFVFNEKHDKFGYYNNCAHFWIRDVIPETIGQYTGLTDKNGKKIFEGDIVQGCWGTRFEVYFDENYLQFRAKLQNGSHREIDYYGDCTKIEVIGNIHDHIFILEDNRNE